jgi:hypothetical protein
MALFVISYDLRKARNYQPVYDKLAEWGAVRLLESFWLASLNGGAGQVRDELAALVDDDDGLAVIELQAGSNWATRKAQAAGNAWLKKHLRDYQ